MFNGHKYRILDEVEMDGIEGLCQTSSNCDQGCNHDHNDRGCNYYTYCFKEWLSSYESFETNFPHRQLFLQSNTEVSESNQSQLFPLFLFLSWISFIPNRFTNFLLFYSLIRSFRHFLFSLRPIVDIVLLLLSIMTTFAVVGYFIFSQFEGNQVWQSSDTFPSFFLSFSFFFFPLSSHFIFVELCFPSILIWT